MEETLKIAGKVADQAEIFFIEGTGTSLSLEDNKPTDVKGAIQAGYALRIIKDGKIGSSYTRNLIDREDFVKNALDSMVGQVKADFVFPEKRPVTSISQYDKKIDREKTVFPGHAGHLPYSFHHISKGITDQHGRKGKIANGMNKKQQKSC